MDSIEPITRWYCTFPDENLVFAKKNKLKKCILQN